MSKAGLAAGHSRILHPLCRRLREREVALVDEFVVEPFEDDPEWLRTPATRRGKALDRLAAIREYEEIGRERRPGVADVERLAGGARVSARQFYSLLDEWSRRRSIFVLLPFSGRQHASVPKLDEAVRINLVETANAAFDKLGPRSPRAILEQVLREWPGDGTKPPSEPTIRAYVADRLGEFAQRQDIFSMSEGAQWKASLDQARHPGDVVIVDHVAPDLFVCLEGEDGRPDDSTAERPALTLAIDLYTQVPVGFALARGQPSPAMIRAALRDAELRTRGAGPPIRPRLMLSTTGGEPWRTLVADLAQAGVRATARWSSRLHHGGPSRRLLGQRLDQISLKARKLHLDGGGRDEFNPDRHALLTMGQAGIVVEDAISKSTRRKLDVDRLPAELIFGLPG